MERMMNVMPMIVCIARPTWTLIARVASIQAIATRASKRVDILKKNNTNELKNMTKCKEFGQIMALRDQIPEGDREASFFLTLRTGCRPGPSFSAGEKYKVLLGKVIEVPGDRSYNYPTEDSQEYLIIPTTPRVVIHAWGWDDYEGVERRSDTLHVFNVSRGWQIINI
jgi:hypothetical protein